MWSDQPQEDGHGALEVATTPRECIYLDIYCIEYNKTHKENEERNARNNK